jgi:hypothetical protein
LSTRHRKVGTRVPPSWLEEPERCPKDAMIRVRGFQAEGR